MKMVESSLKGYKNPVEKGEIARCKQFAFSHSFPKTCTPDT